MLWQRGLLQQRRVPEDCQAARPAKQVRWSDVLGDDPPQGETRSAAGRPELGAARSDANADGEECALLCGGDNRPTALT